MIKYTCSVCHDPCVLIVSNNITMYPRECPYNEFDINEEAWKKEIIKDIKPIKRRKLKYGF